MCNKDYTKRGNVMSESVEVYIQTENSLHNLAQEVGQLLGLKFEYQKDNYDEWYAVRTDEDLFDIMVCDAENDRDTNFEDYEYQVRFWVNRDKEPAEREKLQRQVGQQIFEKLKSTRKYPLMHAFDAQRKLDEFRM